MEFKKKTIIWEDNNEPPKDYIGIKSDGKAYEYSYSQRKGIESKSISGSGNSGNCQCLTPMLVEGTFGDHGFVSSDGAPSWEDAKNYMFHGGLVYLVIMEDGEQVSVNLADFADEESIAGIDIAWYAPIVINGTLDQGIEGLVFIPDNGEMSWNDARSAYNNGYEIYLSVNSGAYDKIVTYSADFHYFETANGVRWSAPLG